MNELIYGVASKLEEDLKHHSLRISIADTIPLFKLDIGLMEQVVFNLLSNATQYTAEGSAILVDAHTKEYIVREKDGLRQWQVNWYLVISDNGPGFPENEIPKVFDKFYRLQQSKRGGTGLGLSIVKGFVEAHNGAIRLQNWKGGGASSPSRYLQRQPISIH